MPVKPDLDNPQAIAQLVGAFYQRLLKDDLLAPLFISVAAVDLPKHLPLICSYWEKLLLGSKDYNRHTMNIHRALNDQQRLRPDDFSRWLSLFTFSVDEQFNGVAA
ncbi:MAG: hemoglobin, partial [Oceanicoccus sp.]